MTQAHWASWLDGAFPRFVLRDAHGAARPSAAVAAALARLHGSPGALSRLAGIAFLLDPALDTHGFMTTRVPRLLRRVLPRTVRESDERRGVVVGRPDWSRTLELRRRMNDRTWFVGVRPRRTFDTPGLRLLRWLIDTALDVAVDVVPGVRVPGMTWVGQIAEVEAAGQAATAHLALRDLPVTTPGHVEWDACAHSPDPTLREAGRLAAHHDRLIRARDEDMLSDAVSRYCLVPCGEDKRFELFTLLATIDALTAVIGRPPDQEHLVAHNRAAVAGWTIQGGELSVFYDQSAEQGRHANVMRHYFAAETPLRPDVRLTLAVDGVARDLVLDAKFSTSIGYLGDAHHKMLAYVADRPDAFPDGRPKAVVVCPEGVVGAVRQDDPVVFVAPADAGWRRPLEELLRAWLAP